MDAITTVATVPAIVALVNVAKRLGLGGRAALALAVVLGVALNVSQTLWGGQAVYQAAVQGLMLGLGASGLYDLTVKPESRADDGQPAQLDPAVVPAAGASAAPRHAAAFVGADATDDPDRP